jgi:hypothetical protein
MSLFRENIKISKEKKLIVLIELKEEKELKEVKDRMKKRIGIDLDLEAIKGKKIKEILIIRIEIIIGLRSIDAFLHILLKIVYYFYIKIIL